ncbi:MAG: chemotaxis protein CheW [Chloroflexaceae bacterium]|nr:chemotaxis protein CheW [Chloroflexaceae bacterium]
MSKTRPRLPTAHLQPLPQEKPPNGTLLTVTFRIGPQLYGLPVSEVVEIVRLPALLTLAGSPPAIIGLLNLRGYYVPVLDGATLVDEPPSYDVSNQIVIAGQTGQGMQKGEMVPLLGVRVDQVVDVHTFQTNQITALDPSIAAPLLRGVINASDRSVFLFNLASLQTMVREAVPETPTDQLESPQELATL